MYLDLSIHSEIRVQWPFLNVQCRKTGDNRLKKNLQYENISHNSTEQLVDGHPENFKIKLYYFEEILSLRYKIIVKLLSLFHICF